MVAYKGCSAPFAATFSDTDVSAFIRMEDEEILVFRSYFKYTIRWETEPQMQLVTAWNDRTLMDSVLVSLATSMNNW